MPEPSRNQQNLEVSKHRGNFLWLVHLDTDQLRNSISKKVMYNLKSLQHDIISLQRKLPTIKIGSTESRK